MKRLLHLLLAGAILMNALPALAEGDIYVVTGGGGVGTKITSLPYTISKPGFYYLGGNLSYTGTGNAITVSSYAVTIDLMGFQISGPGSNVQSSRGIRIDSGYNDLEVRNGCISNFYLALGDSNLNFRTRVLNLRVAQCTSGIVFDFSHGALVKGCSVEVSGVGIGLYKGVATGNLLFNCESGIAGYGTISNNSVMNCNYGIECYGASNVIGNTIFTQESTQREIYIPTSDPCLVTQNTVSGPGIRFTPGSGTVNVPNTNAGF
jgi:Periplasmic copper-binding protein (NosD)